MQYVYSSCINNNFSLGRDERITTFAPHDKCKYIRKTTMGKLIAAIALLLVQTAANALTEGYKYKYVYKDIPFEMAEINAPTFPDREVTITDFGAVGDGMSLCTQAFADAIDALAKQGGGRLTVPPGVWLTGPVVLKSNIDLHIERGAVIMFSPDIRLYRPVSAMYEGQTARKCQSPISGTDLTNVAITGEGVIDGNGQYWRPLKRMKVTEGQWNKLTAISGVFRDKGYWFPDVKISDGDSLARMKAAFGTESDEEWTNIRHYMRPVMISLVGCKNVLLNGVTFQNSPSWNVHPLMCENVIIDNIQVRNPSYAQNGDGLDLESCRNALVVNSVFDVGDDGICIKSGKDKQGRRRGRACENVVIDGCTVYKGHGGFVIGSEMSGGVKNIAVRNCTFLGTDVGLRFKSTRGRGGIVEKIYIDNITMTDIETDAITFDLYYGHRLMTRTMADGTVVPQEVEPMTVDETTPEFRDIHIKDIVCSGAKRALFFNGIPEMPVNNVTLENVTITSETGAELTYCKDILMKNVRIYPEKGETLKTFFCNGIK